MRVKLLAATAALAMAAGGGAIAVATAASAASTGPLQAELYANGNSTANWDMQGNPVLDAGTDNGTSAQVDLAASYAGQPAPSNAPNFTPSASGSGDPRWVIDLHNGCFVTGYPGENVSSNPADVWALNNSGAYTDYGTAIKAAQACGQDDWVTAAYIVDDAGYSGHSVTLTNVQYDGYTLNYDTTNPPNGEIQSQYDPKLDLGDAGGSTQNGSAVVQWTSDGTSDQQWTLEPDGTVENGAAGPNQCLDDPAWGGQGTKVDMYKCVYGQANEQWTYSNGELINAANGLCINDPGYSTTKGVQQILWKCSTSYTNEDFMYPATG